MLRFLYFAALATILLAGSVPAAQAQAVSIFSNLGPGGTFLPFNGFGISGQGLAAQFIPSSSFLFFDAEIALSVNSGTPTAEVFLKTDAGGVPGTVLESFTVTGLNPTPAGILFKVTSQLQPLLVGGTPYWLEVTPADAISSVSWRKNSTGVLNSASNLASNSGTAVWSFLTPGIDPMPAFQIDGKAVQTVSLHFSPGASSTQTAMFLEPGGATDPASHALKFTTDVVNPNGIDLVVATIFPKTDTALIAANAMAVIQVPTQGVGIADGVCEVSALGGVLANVDETKDFDCRLAKGGFVYETLANGDVVVPHCSPYHNKSCAWYRAITSATAQDQVPSGSPICGSGVIPAGPPCYDYVGPVYEKGGWNTNLSLVNPSPNLDYGPGWNNQNDRLYDRHGDSLDIAFAFDITDFYDVNGSVSAVLAGDQTGGGRTKHFNDWVFADVPNPPGTPDTVELLLPAPGLFPFPYLRELPMLVSFKLENEGLEKFDPTALTKPHSVNIATFSNGEEIAVSFIKGFPTTFSYSPFLKVYFIFLSPAPYKTDGTVYTMEIGSDLFQHPVTVNFVVRKD
jgi:hypothetical protein